MPPAIPIIAGLAADALGATAGGALGTALGVGAEGILGTGITGAELGGAVAGGVEGGLMSHSPLGAVLGAAGGGIGGDFLASGVGNLASDVGVNLGLPSAGASTAGATTSAAPAVTPPSVSATATPPIGAGVGGASAIAPAAGTVAPTLDPTASSVAGALSAPTPSSPLPWMSLDTSTPAATAAAAPPPATAPAVAATGAPAASPGVTAPAPNSVEQFMKDPSFGGAWNVVKNNPSAVVGALGLGYDIMNQGSIPGMSQLQGAANQANRSSQELQSYINNGQLPPGFQASMDQAKQAAKAQLRSKYAGLGMSGSTAEAQDLANVDVQAVAAQAQVAAQLLQSGIQEGNIASDLLARIVGINQQEDAATGEAISNFAAAMGGTPIFRVG